MKNAVGIRCEYEIEKIKKTKKKANDSYTKQEKVIENIPN